jgi:hypothetical protein
MIATARETIDEVLGSVMHAIFNPGSEDFHIFAKALGLKRAYVGLGLYGERTSDRGAYRRSNSKMFS